MNKAKRCARTFDIIKVSTNGDIIVENPLYKDDEIVLELEPLYEEPKEIRLERKTLKWWK